MIIRASLPLLTLTLIEARESYGYELVEQLVNMGVAASSGLVYPVLARLERDGNVTARLAASPEGPPRKYFKITADGRRVRDSALEQWSIISAAIAAKQALKEPSDV